MTWTSGYEGPERTPEGEEDWDTNPRFLHADYANALEDDRAMLAAMMTLLADMHEEMLLDGYSPLGGWSTTFHWLFG